MKQNRLTLACGMSALLAGTQFVTATTADNPYLNPITNRNLFSLKAPPDPASFIPVVAPPALPVLTLAGITALMGKTVAILRAQRVAKPPDPAKEISLFLSPGTPAQEGVQVLEINVAAGTVRLINSGTEQTLDIAKNGPKPGAAPAPAAGLPPAPPAGVMPTPPPMRAGATPAITSIPRPVRGNDPGQSGAIPGGGPATMGTPAAPQALTLEEQTIMIEVNRMKEPDLPFPSTDLSETLQQEQQPSGAGGPPKF